MFIHEENIWPKLDLFTYKMRMGELSFRQTKKKKRNLYNTAKVYNSKVNYIIYY